MSRIEICQVCRNNMAKYKCPACLFKYCSVPCYKTHKSSSSDAAVRCSSAAHTTPPQSAAAAADAGASMLSVTPDQDLGAPAPPVTVGKLLLPTQDTVPQNVLHELQHSNELRSLLQSTDLRSDLQQLASCTSGPEAAPLLDAWLRENRDFRHFADSCLNVVAPERNTYREDWTRDGGDET